MTETAGERLLRLLAEGREVEAQHVCVIVAHPDDETIGCGGQLAKLNGASVVLATDGAPRNLVDAYAHGFPSAAAYAEARAAEFLAAMRMAGIPDRSVLMLGVPDQEAAHRMVWLARALTEIFAMLHISIAVTHAYEGGHPDHDAVAFAVHAARRLLRRRRRDLDIIEMPLYRLGDAGTAWQSFAPPHESAETVLRLDAGARERKRLMIENYATQRETLTPFAIEAEAFRIAPDYNFSALPNGGRLLYPHYDWGMTGAQWCALVGEAARQLEQEGAA